MNPLTKHVVVPTDDVLYKLTNLLIENGNIKCCSICSKISLFVDCENCPYKGKKIKTVLIESYIPLAKHIASRIVGGKCDDEVCVGMLALTQSVNNLPKLTIRNIKDVKNYIGAYITCEVKHYVLTNGIIKVPYYGRKTHSFLKHLSRLANKTPIKGEQEKIDIYEALESIPKDEKERTILRCMVEGGYSLKDMEEITGLKQSYISRIKGRLLEKVLIMFKKD